MALKNLSQMDAVVLKVVQRDGLGRVRTVEVLYDHETVDVSIESNREFLVVYLAKGVLKKSNEVRSKKGAN